MSDSNTADSDGKITITETFTIAQAIGESNSIARQSLHINYHLERLVGDKKSCQQKAEEIYDLTYQVSRNLEQMKAILNELNEMILVEKEITPAELPAPKPSANLLETAYSESFKITALAKSLTAWFIEQRPTDEALSALDMDSGDGLELASLIVKHSEAISAAAREADK